MSDKLINFFLRSQSRTRLRFLRKQNHLQRNVDVDNNPVIFSVASGRVRRIGPKKNSGLGRFPVNGAPLDNFLWLIRKGSSGRFCDAQTDCVNGY
jgi:hypothetical protein